jgi:hypothetical protein
MLTESLFFFVLVLSKETKSLETLEPDSEKRNFMASALFKARRSFKEKKSLITQILNGNP